MRQGRIGEIARFAAPSSALGPYALTRSARSFKSPRLVGDWMSLFLFALGLSRFIEFQAVGTLFGTDVAMLVALPFCLRRVGDLDAEPWARRILAVGLMWFASAVLTDFIRGTPAVDFLRGWAKVGMLTIALFVLIILTKLRPDRIAWYLVGFAVATILGVILRPTAYQMGHPWKFGLGLGFGLLAAAAAGWKGANWSVLRNFRLIPMIIVAALCLANNSRSSFGTIGLSVVAVMSIGLIGPLLRRVRMGPAMWMFLMLLGSGAAAAVIELYSVLAARGILGAEAQMKYDAQTAHGGSVLLGGRAEMFVSTRAVLESPIIGHGSWAKGVEYKVMLASILRSRGIDSPLDIRTGQYIPSHSYLFQAWIEHGIVGAVFWLIVLYISIKSVLPIMKYAPRQAPLYFFSTFSLIWAVLFSPFGAETRFLVAAQVCLVLWALRLKIDDPKQNLAPASTAERKI